MTDHRDAITGKYVTAEHAKTNPDTTVSESPCAECERLRGVVHTQGVAIDGANARIGELTTELAEAGHAARSIRAYCEAFVEGSEDRDPEPWSPAAYVLAILDGDPDHDHDANSNSKAQLGVGLEPIVRTVGDLTARHIGKRVRVGDGAGAIEGRLLNIEHDERTTDVAIAEGDQDVADWWPAGPRDTPCEVLG